ncbi:MAG: YfbK domain-containing protein, partial [Luteolibacter sp.]
LNPGDASFQLAKSALAQGELPESADIQHEQFYNAVDYGDPAPASDEPVSATIEQSLHPLIPGRNLVRVAIRTSSTGRHVSAPLHLTLLVDQSVSMLREDRRAALENVLSQLGALLTREDRVTLIGFSNSPRLIADRQVAGGSLNLAGLLQPSTAEDGTNLEQALKLGEQHATRFQPAGGQSRIVLFTDGAADFSEATKDRLTGQVRSLRQKGLALEIARIGSEARNDRWLSELARSGNGGFDAVRDGKNDRFARHLAGPFQSAAEEVEVRVNFNPQRVGSYQLIGFEEKGQSTTVSQRSGDGRIPAGQAGVAIYQVGLLPDGDGDIGEVNVRFRDPASKQTVERNWAIPHASRAVAFDQATSSMQLAGLSLLAAEKLKVGPLAAAIDFGNLTAPRAVVAQFYRDSPRVGDMLRVIEMLK